MLAGDVEQFTIPAGIHKAGHIDGSPVFVCGVLIGEAEDTQIFRGGVAFLHAAVLQIDLVIVRAGNFKIVVKDAGGANIVRFHAGAKGHHTGAACPEAEDPVRVVNVLHALSEHRGDHGSTMGGLDTGSRGLQQMADGADVGIDILGVIHGKNLRKISGVR